MMAKASRGSEFIGGREAIFASRRSSPGFFESTEEPDGKHQGIQAVCGDRDGLSAYFTGRTMLASMTMS